ncbi:MAG: TerB family tellurite resistance protein [Prevotellaceae bacterium]|nr:TerB family tellurite resistance protein [Prevotellaceae bacterium]MDD6779686.1 TerB family tellurite resistance protein [Prevotellaceae bacterium]
MSAGKWIGGIIGWITAGPLGALAGVAIGAMFDVGLDSVNNPGNAGTREGAFGDNGSRQYSDDEQRSGFMFSLLVLASYVIRADGRVMHSEMQLVREFLRQNFGVAAQSQGEQILLRLFDEQKRQGTFRFKNTVADCCQQIARYMDYSQRLQLVNFLVLISQADGKVDPQEVMAINECGHWLGMSKQDIDSLFSLKGDTLDEAYKVLGVSPDATDDEVRKAYRKLALEHHPDRVAALGEDVRKAAEKKFQEINAAKEKVFKARGL